VTSEATAASSSSDGGGSAAGEEAQGEAPGECEEAPSVRGSSGASGDSPSDTAGSGGSGGVGEGGKGGGMRVLVLDLECGQVKASQWTCMRMHQGWET